MPPSPQGIAIGRQLQQDFARRVAKLHLLGEIPLFRCLINALKSSSHSGFAAKEYHGSKYQVRHNTGFPVAHLGLAQCELCDVMILSLDARKVVAPRVTFLQAKYHRSRRPAGVGNHTFSGDLVQWSLLRHRPTLQKPQKGPLQFPKNLLSGAALNSIGSFGFFTGDRKGGIELSYASADVLAPVGRAGRAGRQLLKNEKLQGTFAPYRVRRRRGLSELETSTGLDTFVGGLHDLVVGTPLAPGRNAGPVLSVLRAVRSTVEDSDEPVLVEAIEQIEALNPPGAGHATGYPTVLLVRANSRP